jgi:hypothetical protein
VPYFRVPIQGVSPAKVPAVCLRCYGNQNPRLFTNSFFSQYPVALALYRITLKPPGTWYRDHQVHCLIQMTWTIRSLDNQVESKPRVSTARVTKIDLSDGVFNLHQNYVKNAVYYIFVLVLTTYSSQKLPSVKAGNGLQNCRAFLGKSLDIARPQPKRERRNRVLECPQSGKEKPSNYNKPARLTRNVNHWKVRSQIFLIYGGRRPT